MAGLSIALMSITFIFAYLSVNVDNVIQKRDLEVGQYTALQIFFSMVTAFTLPFNSYGLSLVAKDQGMTELSNLLSGSFLQFSILIMTIIVAYFSYYFIFVVLKEQKDMFD